MSRTAGDFDGLPLFASDEAISMAFLGPGKTREWKQIATLLEGRGLPKIDALMGGRYVPAVRAFFDREYGLIEKAPRLAPSGIENLGAWNRDRPKTRRVRPA